MTAAATADVGTPRPKQPAGGASLREARRLAARRRQRKVRLVAAGFLSVLAMIAAWMQLLRPAPATRYVSFAFTQYVHFPVNPFAQQDGDTLVRHFSATRSGNRFTDQERRQTFLARLDDIQGWTDRVIVVHLCAHAWSDGPEVFLLAGDSQPGDPKTAVALGEVLTRLRRCKDNRPHKVLLLLDVMRPLADPALGILIDDVPRAVKALVTEALAKKDADADNELVVLAACDAGQQSLVSEELGLSVFGYYLDQGLSGRADGYPEGTGTADGRVSVRELAAFVSDRVERWAWHNRRARQRPLLIPEEPDDFNLVSRIGQPAAEDEAKEPEYPKPLLDDWKARDGLAADGRRFLPGHLLALEAELLRAERRWRFSRPDREDKDKEDMISRRIDKARGLIDALEQGRRNLPQPVPHSLALAEQLKVLKPDAAARTQANDLLDALDNLPPGDDKGAAKAAIDKFLEAQPKERPDVTVEAVLTALARPDRPLKGDTVAALESLWKARPVAAKYAETAFVHRLALMRQARKGDWPQDAAYYALQAVRDGERRISEGCEGPFVAARVKKQFEEAADKRHQAEAVLFDPTRNPAAKETDLLKEAAAEYDEAGKFQEDFKKSRAAYDEVLALLPEVAAATWQRGDDVDWGAAAAAARRAAESLAGQKPLPPAERRDLASKAAALRQVTNDKIDRLIKEAEANADPGAIGEADPSLIRKIELWLLTPLPGADDRKKLWVARHNLARRLHRETVELDRRDDPARRTTPADARGSGIEPSEVQRALCRARTFLGLTSLAGLPADRQSDLDGRVRGLTGTTDPASRDWQDAGRRLRDGWGKLLEMSRATGSAARTRDEKVLLEEDRRNRILGASGGVSALDNAGKGPTAEHRRRMADYWAWLADYYAKEAEAAAQEEEPAALLYRKAAEGYRGIARAWESPR